MRAYGVSVACVCLIHCGSASAQVPPLVARWECVGRGSAVWNDSGPGRWHGAVYGASLHESASGLAAAQLARNDLLEAPLGNLAWAKGPWTLTLWLNPATRQHHRSPRIAAIGDAYMLHLSREPRFRLASNAFVQEEGKKRPTLFQAASKPDLQAQTWHHAAVVIEPNTHTLYVDGKLARRVRTTGLPTIAADALRVGSLDIDKEEGVNALMGPVTLYGGALSAAQVQALYAREAAQWGRVQVHGLQRPKVVSNFAFVRLRSGSTEFGISRAGGFVRNFRYAPQPALIEYVSLREGDRRQIELDGSQWKVDWAGRTLEVLHGRTVRYTGQPTAPGWDLRPWLMGTPLLLLEPEAGRAALALRGSLGGPWRERVSYSRGRASELLSWHWDRTESPCREPVEVTLQLMRWAHSYDPAPTIVRKNGRLQALSAEARAMAPEDELVMYAWPLGRAMRARLDSPCDVRAAAIRRYVGGQGIVFRPKNPDRVAKLSMTVETRAMPHVRAGLLDGFVHPSNGALWLGAGGMPLLGVEAFEAQRLQSQAGVRGEPWRTAVSSDTAGTVVKGLGRLQSPTEFEWTLSDRAVQCTWRRTGDVDAPAGYHLTVPYEWVGAVVQVVPAAVSSAAKMDFRLGADIDLGPQAAGTRLVLHLTGTEQASIRLDTRCRVVSYRKRLAATGPFAEVIPFAQAYPSAVAKAEVIELQPPGGLVLSCDPGEREFRLSISYERRPAPVPRRVHTRALLSGDGIRVRADKPNMGDVTVETRWWRVVHEQRRGGAVSHISFPMGSGRNILVAPVASYIRSDGVTFAQDRDASAKVRVVSVGPKDVEVMVTGVLCPEEGDARDVRVPYTCRCQYTPWWLKRTVEFDFGDGGRDVSRIGVLRLDARRELDMLGDKPCVARWQKAVFPGPTLGQVHRVVGVGMLLFDRGVEGIGFMPDSDMRAWRQAWPERPDKAYIAIEGNGQAGPRLLVEPLRVSKPLRLSGRLKYGHYLGLPCVRERLARVHRPCYLGHNPWLTPGMAKRLADAGVNLLIAGFSDGGFGYFVPTDAKYGQAVHEFIQTAHAHGIRTVPFTAPSLPLKRLPAKCKEHFDDWVILKQRGAKLEPLAGPTWYYFCYDAPGFIDYLKEGLPRTMREFAFDGLYCDGFYPMGTCHNAAHGPSPHACWEGLLDFARWSRESLLGRDKVLYAHTGYYPTFIVDNLCDLTWIFEEVNYWCNKEGRICSLERLSEMTAVVPNTQRALDMTPVDRWMTYRGENVPSFLHLDSQDIREYTARMALCGVFPTIASCRVGPRSEDDMFDRLAGYFRLTRTFRDVDLSKFRFADWRSQSAAVADAADVRCAVYWNAHEALVVAANTECRDEVGCRLRIRPDAFGWARGSRCEWRVLPDGRPEAASLDALAQLGMPLKLEGFDYRVFSISR